MKWVIGVLEYDITCSRCGHDTFTFNPVKDAYMCEQCKYFSDATFLIDTAEVKDPLGNVIRKRWMY